MARMLDDGVDAAGDERVAWLDRDETAEAAHEVNQPLAALLTNAETAPRGNNHPLIARAANGSIVPSNIGELRMPATKKTEIGKVEKALSRPYNRGAHRASQRR